MLTDHLNLVHDPNLLVGFETGDDAAVYRLTGGLALVQTVDFFTPIVDDPFTYGAISAANSLSDIYAMGAKPLTAMNIASFPQDLPKEILREILRGGAAKAAEAGVPIVGGHTIYDKEPKYGMAVTGVVRPGKELTNAGARPGDVLVLTKPLGTGVITTAFKNDRTDAATLEVAVRHMTALNKAASEAAVAVGVHACTDVTGYGLLGHLRGMLRASHAGAAIFFSRTPLMRGAWELAAEQHISPGGTSRNKEYHDSAVAWDAAVHPEAWRLLYDPQTSGGLLISVSPRKARRLVEMLHQAGVAEAAAIGKVTAGEGAPVTVTA